MADSQRVYVHDTHTIQDDGEEVTEISLNTRGHTPFGVREQIYSLLVKRGIVPSELANEVGNDIATVVIEDGEIKELSIDDAIIEEYT